MARAIKLPKEVDARHPDNRWPKRVSDLKMGQRAVLGEEKLERDLFGRLYVSRRSSMEYTIRDGQDATICGRYVVIERVRGGLKLYTAERPITVNLKPVWGQPYAVFGLRLRVVDIGKVPYKCR